MSLCLALGVLGVMGDALGQDDDDPFASPAPTGSSSTARPGSGALAGSGDVNYDLRLRELEDRVNELKEDIFRSKSRLFLLREQILQDNIGGSRLVVRHTNLMGSRYRPVRAIYSLDGNQLLNATGTTADLDGEFQVFAESVLPGPHNLSVRMEFEGNTFGAFAYMDGYEFTVQDSYQFTLDEGQTVEIEVEVYELGGVNTPMEDRAALRFNQRVYETSADSVAEER